MIIFNYSENPHLSSNSSLMYYVCNYLYYYTEEIRTSPKGSKNNKISSSPKRAKKNQKNTPIEE